MLGAAQNNYSFLLVILGAVQYNHILLQVVLLVVPSGTTVCFWLYW